MTLLLSTDYRTGIVNSITSSRAGRFLVSFRTEAGVVENTVQHTGITDSTPKRQLILLSTARASRADFPSPRFHLNSKGRFSRGYLVFNKHQATWDGTTTQTLTGSLQEQHPPVHVRLVTSQRQNNPHPPPPRQKTRSQRLQATRLALCQPTHRLPHLHPMLIRSFTFAKSPSGKRLFATVNLTFRRRT